MTSDSASRIVRSSTAGDVAGRTVLLLHGLANSVDYWSKVQPLLAEDLYVIAIDIPGFGESDADEVSIDVAVAAALAAIDGHAPALVVGHSMGAAVALALATRHPDHVTGVVLLNAAVDEATRLLRPQDWLHIGKPAAALGVQVVFAVLPTPAALVRLVLKSQSLRSAALRWFVADPQRLDVELVVTLASARRHPLAVVRALAEARRVTMAGLLATCPKRVTLVGGAEDRLAPPRAQDALRELVTSSITLSNCGHWSLLEQPEEVARVIRECAETTSALGT